MTIKHNNRAEALTEAMHRCERAYERMFSERSTEANKAHDKARAAFNRLVAEVPSDRDVVAPADGQMPAWAIGLAHGQYDVLGAQLSTRDGRVTGNAHIIAIDVRVDAEYTLLTDAGSTLKYTYQELKSGFYPPMWISDVTEVVRKFQPRPDSDDQLQPTVNWLINSSNDLSVTDIQIQFHIGYNRAKRLLDVAKQQEIRS